MNYKITCDSCLKEVKVSTRKTAIVKDEHNKIYVYFTCPDCGATIEAKYLRSK